MSLSEYFDKGERSGSLIVDILGFGEISSRWNSFDFRFFDSMRSSNSPKE